MIECFPSTKEWFVIKQHRFSQGGATGDLILTHHSTYKKNTKADVKTILFITRAYSTRDRSLCESLSSETERITGRDKWMYRNIVKNAITSDRMRGSSSQIISQIQSPRTGKELKVITKCVPEHQ